MHGDQSPKRRGGRPKAAHHLNHPMYIPGRDESRDEKSEIFTKAVTLTAYRVEKSKRKRTTFFRYKLYLHLFQVF